LVSKNTAVINTSIEGSAGRFKGKGFRAEACGWQEDLPEGFRENNRRKTEDKNG
jgi:hypothetical protein